MILVETWELAAVVCSRLLADCRVFAFDLEGVNLGRKGHVTLLQIAVDERTSFCFDILVLGQRLFGPDFLGPLFTSPRILKICFDCRVDGDVLQSHFGLKLTTLYDIQVLYTLLFQARTDRYLKGMRHVLLMPGVVEHSTALESVLCTKRRMKDLMARKHIFLERPIAAEVLQYCGADVLYLLRMHSLWQHSLPSERIIAKSMDRLSQFYTRSSEIPARKMAEIDFARC